VRVKIYNKKVPSLSSIVTAKLISNLTISVTPSQNQTLAAWSEKTFTVTVNGDNSDNWTPYVTGAGAGNVSIDKMTYNTFKVTNENNENISKVAVVGAKSTTRENVTSNEVSVLVKNKPTTTIKCCIIQENYPCQVSIDIWPYCEGEEPDESKIANFTCDNCPTETDGFQSWEEDTIIKDKNNKYYVRFNRPLESCVGNKGYVDVYTQDGVLMYSLPGTLHYLIPEEYDLTNFFKGNILYIKFKMNGIR